MVGLNTADTQIVQFATENKLITGPLPLIWLAAVTAWPFPHLTIAARWRTTWVLDIADVRHTARPWGREELCFQDAQIAEINGAVLIEIRVGIS